MKKLYIVQLKNRDDYNVVAESFAAAADMVARDHGDDAILRIESAEEIKEG